MYTNVDTSLNCSIASNDDCLKHGWPTSTPTSTPSFTFSYNQNKPLGGNRLMSVVELMSEVDNKKNEQKHYGKKNEQNKIPKKLYIYLARLLYGLLGR